jgi:hypothetical protein
VTTAGLLFPTHNYVMWVAGTRWFVLTISCPCVDHTSRSSVVTWVALKWVTDVVKMKFGRNNIWHAGPAAAGLARLRNSIDLYGICPPPGDHRGPNFKFIFPFFANNIIVDCPRLSVCVETRTLTPFVFPFPFLFVWKWVRPFDRYCEQRSRKTPWILNAGTRLLIFLVAHPLFPSAAGPVSTFRESFGAAGIPWRDSKIDVR